jgi:hypothetical protein
MWNISLLSSLFQYFHMRSELLDSFDPSLDDSTLQVLESICSKFNIEPEDLFYKWEAFTLTLKDSPDLPTRETAIKLSINITENINLNKPKKTLNKASLSSIVQASQAKFASRAKLIPRDLNSQTKFTTPVKSNNANSFDQTIYDLSSPA